MTASASSPTSLPLRGAVAILLIFMGVSCMIGGGLIGKLAFLEKLIAQIEGAHIERFTGLIEGCAIALLFAGLAIALKATEKRLRTQEQIDWTTDSEQ
jgi:uncharacterized membrane protein required for colicin V production